MAYGGPPFLGTIFPAPDVGNIYLIWMIDICDTVSTLPRMFFEKQIWQVTMGLLYIKVTY